MASKGLTDDKIVNAIESHKINYEYLSTDNFDAYFIDRTKQIIKCIEKAMGKTISGLDSEDTIREFGVSLSE
jgi:hypothetical protein